MLTTPTAPAAALDVREAPPVELPPVRAGSLPDAKAVRARLQTLLQGLERADEVLLRLAAQAQEQRVYLLLTDERGRFFTSWTAFCTSPQPWGLGISQGLVDELAREHRDPARRARLIMDAPLILRYRGGVAGKALPRSPDRPPPRKRETRSGEYLLQRLKREHPHLLEQVATGKLPSILAAAVEAGLRQPVLHLVGTPMNLARAIVCRFGPAEQAAIVDLVQHPERITAPAGPKSAAWKRFAAGRDTPPALPTPPPAGPVEGSEHPAGGDGDEG